MRRVFLDFLVAEGLLPADRLEDVWSFLRNSTEPVGSIAFSHGLLCGSDIDLILEEQRRRYRPFGEIAVEMGILRIEQVEALLLVQQIRAAVEAAESLALSGVCAVEDMKDALGRFFRQAVSSSSASPCPVREATPDKEVKSLLGQSSR